MLNQHPCACALGPLYLFLCLRPLHLFLCQRPCPGCTPVLDVDLILEVDGLVMALLVIASPDGLVSNGLARDYLP